jgi:hypothetical protein
VRSRKSANVLFSWQTEDAKEEKRKVQREFIRFTCAMLLSFHLADSLKAQAASLEA